VFRGKKKGEVPQIITKFIIIWMSPCLHSPFKCYFILFLKSHHYKKIDFLKDTIWLSKCSHWPRRWSFWLKVWNTKNTNYFWLKHFIKMTFSPCNKSCVQIWSQKWEVHQNDQSFIKLTIFNDPL
jgi:hypothetical protein